MQFNKNWSRLTIAQNTVVNLINNGGMQLSYQAS